MINNLSLYNFLNVASKPRMDPLIRVNWPFLIVTCMYMCTSLIKMWLTDYISFTEYYKMEQSEFKNIK